MASGPPPLQPSLCYIFDRWPFSFCRNTCSDKELRAAKGPTPTHPSRPRSGVTCPGKLPQFTQGDQLLQALLSLSTPLSPHHSLLPWDLSFCSHICLSHWPQNISRKRAVCYSSLHPRFLIQHVTPRYVTPVMTVDADKCVLLSQAILFLNK